MCISIQICEGIRKLNIVVNNVKYIKIKKATIYTYIIRRYSGIENFVLSATHLSQDSSFRSVKVEKKSSEEIIVLHQLFPRSRWHVAAGSSTSQGNGYLHFVPRYSSSVRGDIIQAFLIVARWHVVDGLGGTSAGLFGRRIRIVRAL